MQVTSVKGDPTRSKRQMGPKRARANSKDKKKSEAEREGRTTGHM
jgi:hypothetical protein